MKNDSEIQQHEGQRRPLRKKARTRVDLLAAARQVFATHGYHETSIAEITQAADVGVGTFYLHFRDKDEIFTTLIEEGVRDIRERVTAAAVQQPYEQMFAAIVRLTFRYAYEERDIFRIALTGGGMFVHKFRAQVALIEGFSSIFALADEQGLLEGYDIELLARLVTGVIVQGIMWWFEHDEPQPDVMAEQVMLLFRQGLPARMLVEGMALSEASFLQSEYKR